MSTLAEDQAQAANQGKAGYDLLGNALPGTAGTNPNAANPITGAQTPPAAAAPAPSTASPYYPRYTPAEQAADATLSAPVVAQSEGDIVAQKTKEAQGQIDSLNKHYDDLLAEQSTINQGRDRSTSSVSTLTGLAGSSEANVQADKTTALNQQDNQKIQDERNAAVQTILSNIRSNAVIQAQQSRAEARQSAQDILTQRTAHQTEAVKHLTDLAASGATAAGLKATDPQSYDYLARNVGGEDQLQALFTLNRPQDAILDKQIQNGKYVIAYKNPITGQVRIESTDLGIPPGYSKTVDAGDRILAIPDNWNGDPSQLKTINKGLPPAAAAGSASVFAASQNPNLIAAVKAGLIDPSKVNSRTAPFYSALANTGVNANQLTIDAAATKKVITNLDTQSAQITQAGQALESNMAMLAGLSDKVNTLGIPAFDTDLNAVMSKYSNQPDIVKYLSVLSTVRAEYAKYIARGSQVDDATKREAAGAIPAGVNGDVLRSLLTTLQTEGANVQSSIQAAKKGQWEQLQGTPAQGGGNVITAPDGTQVQIID